MKIQKKFRKIFPKKRITILTLPQHYNGSVCSWLTECWTEMGYRVEVISDLKQKIKTDLLIIHLDLTEIPVELITEASQYCHLNVNGLATSIDKTLFSKHILQANSEYENKVIVKTKENYGGIPELINKIKEINYSDLNEHFEKIQLAFHNQTEESDLLWRTTSILDPSNYPIFESFREVPSCIWENPKLMVEKFLPEINEDGNHVLRHWYFFGDREFNRKLTAKHHCPKWASMTEHERILSRNEWWDIKVTEQTRVPKEVISVRENLNLDFGRIDWVFNDGEPVVFDANKTPGIGTWSLESEFDRHRSSIMKDLAKGIDKFFI